MTASHFKNSSTAISQGKNAPKFLCALYDMLQYEDPAILAWSHDGACFQVFDVQRLEHEVLAKYFKHSKFSSLQRQLNNFGFRKWTKTRANVCTFSHDALHKCHPSELSDLVQRTKVTRAGSASTASASVAGKRPRVTTDAASSPVEKKRRMADLDGGSERSFVAALEEVMLLQLDQDMDMDMDLDMDMVLAIDAAVDEDASLLFDGLEESQLLDLEWTSVPTVDSALLGALEASDFLTDHLALSDDDVALLLSESELADALGAFAVV